jgi:hypothetical protein
MVDASLVWGGDLAATPAGDLATVDGSGLGQQRVLRRLLTNLKDYTWEPGYGGGLGQFVGGIAGSRTIEGVIRSQLRLEAAVAVQPEPRVASSTSPDGSVSVDIAYADAPSGLQQAVSFSLGA